MGLSFTLPPPTEPPASSHLIPCALMPHSLGSTEILHRVESEPEAWIGQVSKNGLAKTLPGNSPKNPAGQVSVMSLCLGLGEKKTNSPRRAARSQVTISSATAGTSSQLVWMPRILPLRSSAAKVFWFRVQIADWPSARAPSLWHPLFELYSYGHKTEF